MTSYRWPRSQAVEPKVTGLDPIRPGASRLRCRDRIDSAGSSRNGLSCRERKASAAHPIDIPPKEVEKRITARIARHLNNLVLIELGQRLNALRDRYADIQQSSLDFLWELLELARDTVAAVKVLKEVPREEQGKAALTELSEALKTDQKPIIVVNIVNRIDEVVRAVRFEGWQTTI